MTDAQTLLQEGLSAFRARAYDQALQSWRALLEIEPENQHVLQLVERTEALAAEGHLVHSLKEELADLREELASTRQARNELLIEMARVHKKYQAREARLWRLQEAREWELRDALAHAELSNLSPSSDNDDTSDAQHRLTTNALEEAHAHIRRLRDALDEAHQRIDALERAQDPSAHSDDASTPPAPPTESAEPTKERTRRDTANTPHPPAFDSEEDADSDESSEGKTTQTRPSRTLPEDEVDDPATDDAAEDYAPRGTSHTHTQTSHTLRAERGLFETGQEQAVETTTDDFDGPLISDEWLQESENDSDDASQDAPIQDALVDIVRDASSEDAHPAPNDDAQRAASNETVTASADDSDEDEPTTEHPIATEDDAPDTDASEAPRVAERPSPPTQRAAPVPPAPIEDDADTDTDDAPDEDTDEDAEEDTAAVATPQNDDAQGTSDAPSAPQAPPPAPTDEDTSADAAKDARSNIPDTAKIDAEPMDDKNIADGFADELTSALGSTPAPPRLFTGVQPELPDMDILDQEPQKMRPEDLEKYPTSVPVRHKSNPEIDDPIARYLLTHVDGVSTFMELRGTVGLPPAAVDRGFRILLAHDVIRVQHE